MLEISAGTQMRQDCMDEKSLESVWPLVNYAHGSAEAASAMLAFLRPGSAGTKATNSRSCSYLAALVGTATHAVGSETNECNFEGSKGRSALSAIAR